MHCVIVPNYPYYCCLINHIWCIAFAMTEPQAHWDSGGDTYYAMILGIWASSSTSSSPACIILGTALKPTPLNESFVTHDCLTWKPPIFVLLLSKTSSQGVFSDRDHGICVGMLLSCTILSLCLVYSFKHMTFGRSAQERYVVSGVVRLY